MRRSLDMLYRAAAWAAAACLLAIFVLVMAQVSLRLLDAAMRLAGQRAFGFIVPSIAEICGFLLAEASFLALAHTLASGGHIRVGMLIDRLGRARPVVEAGVALLATLLAGYATLAVGRLAWKSWAFNDVSYGIVAVPLWLPQGIMTLGLAILVVSLLDVAWRAWRGEVLRGGAEG